MWKTSSRIGLVLALLSGLTLAQNHKLLPGDPETQAHFGTGVAVGGDLVLVGSGTLGISSQGAAYLFNATTGAQLVKLLPSDAAIYDNLGTRVAMEGTRLLVSAPGDDQVGPQVGSVYFFDAITFEEIGKFVAEDSLAQDRLGDEGLDVSGSIGIVTSTKHNHFGRSSGVAYLFSVPSGNQLHKLLPSDGWEQDRFGQSAAIDGGLAVVGAADDDDLGASSGSVYVFDVATGAQLRKIIPADGHVTHRFGYDIDLDGTHAIIGAHGDDDVDFSAGAAYVFDVTTGNQLAKLTATDGEFGDALGVRVAIEGSLAVVGASGDDYAGGTGQGSVYVFDWTTGEQLHKVAAWDMASGAAFGYAVDLAGSKFSVGAWNDDENGFQAGAAYVFDLPSLDNRGTAYCFGDGTGTTCPCGLVSPTGQGCPNSGGAGATLESLGSASMSLDTFGLQVEGCPGNKPGLVLRGSLALNAGQGNPVGDGLLCASGQTARSQVQVTSAGSTTFSDFRGMPFGATSSGVGATTYYQFWYRDAANACSGSGFNFTNAWEVDWLP